MSEMAHKATIGRREFLLGGLTAAGAVGCLDLGFSTAAGGTGDLSATHNMLIIGTKTTFLYHLPMFSFPGFDSPHRYQVILEASFSQREKDLGDVFAAERKAHGESNIYTFSPEKFVLQDLAPQIKKAPLRQLSGTIFRGHLEKGGTSIFKDVTAAVRVVYFSEFTSKATASKAKARAAPKRYLQYILFGAGPELFLAHLVTQPPDFDQILPVTLFGRFPSPLQEPTNEDLKRGMVIGFPQMTNTISRRLKPGLRVGNTPERVRVINSEVVKAAGVLELLADKEIYLEEGELLVPPQFATTAAERAAGFP